MASVSVAEQGLTLTRITHTAGNVMPNGSETSGRKDYIVMNAVSGRPLRSTGFDVVLATITTSTGMSQPIEVSTVSQ